MQPDPDAPRLLDVIDIPKPCQVPWDTMTGDDQIRFCGMCKKNVYNISEMGTFEAETFLQENLGSVCFGFIRRADGTIVTDTCPKIFKPVRNGFRWLKKIVALILGAVMSSSAALAQGESESQFKKQLKRTIADGRGPSPRFGYVPNVWHLESQRLPPGYGAPVKNNAVSHGLKSQHSTSLSLHDLTTGDFALEFESELYMKDGKAFINEERKAHNTQKEPVYYTKRTGSCIDGCTATVAFLHAKEWVAKHEDRIAESYFKLSLKSIDYLNPEPKLVIMEIVREYADLLKRTGRVKDAQLLLKRDVVTEVQKFHRVRARSALGLDPAMLAGRPRPSEPKPRVKPLAPFSAEPILNPFAPASQPQRHDTGEKKELLKAKEAKQ